MCSSMNLGASWKDNPLHKAEFFYFINCEIVTETPEIHFAHQEIKNKQVAKARGAEPLNHRGAGWQAAE